MACGARTGAGPGQAMNARQQLVAMVLGWQGTEREPCARTSQGTCAQVRDQQ